jgi:hypothetical protein
MFKRNRLLTYLLPIQILLVNFLSRYPDFIEKYYSNGIYPYISSFFRIILGWIPFSVGDILLFIAFIYIFISIWRFVKLKQKNYKELFFNIGSKLAVLYFIFYLFWGINYYRKPLSESMQLAIPEYNIEELSLLTERLLIKTQEIHFKLTKNDTIPVQTVLSQNELLDRTAKGYENLAKKYPQFTYTNPKVKKSLFSTPMSYMGFGGYLNPITGESQVNYNLLDFNIPSTASHEVAHQIGYANESEANFIGYLAAINNKDLLFQYSANLMALQYAMGAIYRNDKDLYKEIKGRLPIGVLKNITENHKQWKKYDNPLEPYFKKFYGFYLKANHQKHGMKSYGRMLGLLMAYENQNNS